MDAFDPTKKRQKTAGFKTDKPKKIEANTPMNLFDIVPVLDENTD